MKKLFRLLALTLCSSMLVALAACGDKAASSKADAGTASETSSSTSAVESTASTDASSSAEATNDALAAIKAKGKIVMMTNGTFPPFEYAKEEGGVNGVSGVDVELAKLVAKELGVELEILDMNFDLLIASLQGGKGDFVAAGMSITDERKEQVDFSIPYVNTKLFIVVPQGSDIKSKDDLKGLKVAVQENTTSDLLVSDYVENAEVLRFKSALEAGGAVINKKADLLVIDEMTGKNIVDNAEGKLIILEEPLSQEQYAMAFAKGNEELVAAVNSVLEKAVAEGLVDKLITEHMEAAKG